MLSSPDLEILETLGEGNFGVVYVAKLREGTLARTVVLKVLKQHFAENDQAIVRARDEAALLARLNHDHIVKVEQLTTLQGMPTVVMEHILGLTLDRLLHARGPLPVGVTLDIAVRVTSALDAAFARVPPGEHEPLRVVHRDIKPSNVIVSVNGLVKVLDFGAARGDFADRLAQTQSMALGTPLYMAPEIFEGATPAPSVDVYALGATMVELLSGAPLGPLSFKPGAHARKLKARLDAVCPPDLTENAARPLREILAATLDYEPDRRPSVRELQERCRAYKGRLGRTVALDVWAERVVEPLYAGRQPIPPPPKGSSLLSPLPQVLSARSTDWSLLPPVVSSTPVPIHVQTALLEELDLDPLEPTPPKALDRTPKRVLPTPEPVIDPPEAGEAARAPTRPPPRPPRRPLLALAGLGLAAGMGLTLLANALRPEPEVPAVLAAPTPEGEPAAPEGVALAQDPTPSKTTTPAPEPTKPTAPAPEPTKPTTPAPEPTKTTAPAPEPTKPTPAPRKPPRPAGPAPETPQVQEAPPPAVPAPPSGGTVSMVGFRSIPASATVVLPKGAVLTPTTLESLPTGPLRVRVLFDDEDQVHEGFCDLVVREDRQSFTFKLVEEKVQCPLQ